MKVAVSVQGEGLDATGDPRFGRAAKAAHRRYCGPNASCALQAAGIKVYTGLASGGVRQAVERHKAGALQEATGADVRGHW